MSLFERAWLYVTRKKGRTMVIFCIFLVMATAILTGISIKKAAQVAMQQARESVGGNFSLSVNYDESNPNIKQEETKSEFGVGIRMENTGDPLSDELIQKVGGTNGIKGYNASAMLSLDDGDLKYVEPKQQAQDNALHFSSGGELPNIQLDVNLNSEYADLFQNGKMKLIEGEHIKSDGKQQVLIHKKFAELNDLSVGDKMTLKLQDESNKTEAEVVGIFDDNKKSDVEEYLPFLMSENQVLCDIETGKLLQGKDTFEFDVAKFFVKDPKDMLNIVDDVKKLDIDWQQFAIDTNDMQYQQIAGPIENVDQIITVMLYIVLIISCVILTLILSLWIKGRIYETGILLSLGISKMKIIGQYVVELLLISILAFGLSFLSGKAVSQTIGNALIDSIIANKENQMMQGGMVTSSISIGGSFDEEEIKALDVSVSVRELGIVYVIGTSLIIVSVILSSTSILRLKPKEILSKMS